MVELTDGTNTVTVAETEPLYKPRTVRKVQHFIPGASKLWVKKVGGEGVRVNTRGLLQGPTWLTDLAQLRSWDDADTLLNLWDQVQEVNAIVIADDGQAAFWTLTKVTGSPNNIDVSIADYSGSGVQRGANCLKIDAVAGSLCARWYIRKEYGSAQDWSGKSWFILYWCGLNNGATIKILVRASSGAWTDVWETSFVDNVASWRRLVVAKSTFVAGAGSPSWATVYGVQIEQFTANKTGQNYLDLVAMDSAVKLVQVQPQFTPGWADMVRVDLSLVEA